MYKYHCLNAISKKGTDKFGLGYEAVEQMEDADAVLVRSAAMHDMEFSSNLKAIARAGAGVNNIPLDKCAEQGIVVFNTPGANANAVKELVLAGMFLAARDVVGGIEWVKANVEDEQIAKTTEKKKKAFAGTEIQGKRLGVIGLGAIGILVANAAVTLGMEVYGYDPYVSVDAAWRLSRNIHHAATVDEIYKECDYVTIHVPALSSTVGMINKEAIDLMKDDVIVLNFARDTLVNTTDMLEALDTGKVKRYVTDFPVPGVIGHKGTIVIPHLGASTEESEENCAQMAVAELKDYLENGNISHSVNYPDCNMGIKECDSRITVLHKNIPNMIGQLTSVVAQENMNITLMTNKSKKEYAYTMLDVEADVPEDVEKKLCSIPGVLKVRVIK